MRVNHSLLIPIILSTLSFNAHSGIKQEMDDFWDLTKQQSIDARGTTINESASGTTYSFGSMKARVPVKPFQLYHITPPSIKSGCNGIDVNFGAFSHVSASEIKEMLARTMQGVPYYAFSVAMNAICPTCNQTMQKLAKTANEFAAKAKDSCSAAKMLVEMGGENSLGSAIRDGLKDYKIEFGAEEDAGAAQNSAEPPEKDIPAKALKERQFNVTYYALVQNRTASMYGAFSNSSIQETREILMSLVGTYYAHFDGVNYNTSDSASIDADLKYGFITEGITPQNLVDGVSSGTPVNIISCNETIGGSIDVNNPNVCVRPEKVLVNSLNIPSFKEKIKSILSSIEQKIGQRGTASRLSADETAFIQYDELGIYTTMMSLRHNDLYRTFNFPEDTSELIAKLLAYRFTMKMLDTIKAAISNTDSKLPSNQKTEILKHINKKASDYKATLDRLQSQMNEKKMVYMKAVEINRQNARPS